MSILSGDGFRDLVSAQGVVDASGNCTIQFPVVNKGAYQTGSVTIYDSPAQIQWNWQLNGQTFDLSNGPATVGNVQQGSQDNLTVSATGLTNYIGQTFHATFTCIVSQDPGTPLIVPGHDPYQASVSVVGTQSAFPNTPHAANVPDSVNYQWPAGGPYAAVKLVISAGAAPTYITVTGRTTGIVYLSENSARGIWTLDISSLVEPAGINVTTALPGSWTGLWNMTYSLIACVFPQIVRTVYGPGDQGPLSYASGLVIASNAGGQSIVNLFGGAKGNAFRIYTMWLNLSGTNGIANSSAYILNGTIANPALLTLTLGAGGGNQADSISIPGGFLLDSNTLGLNSIVVAVDNNAGTGTLVGRGGVYYSEES